MANGSVDFRANANGIVIVFGENDDFNSIYEQIARKLDSGGYFFHTRYFAATYRGRRLDPAEERMISKMMAEKTGAKTVTFEIDPDYVPTRARYPQSASPYSARLTSSGHVRISADFIRRQPHYADERLTKYVRSSLRQDQSVRYDGDIVVIGDLNEGAKVYAAGNVIVLGTARGAVHAGIAGDAGATVISLEFMSSGLSIAGIDDLNRHKRPEAALFWPEIAFVEDGEVVYAPLTDRQLAPLTL